MTVTHTETDGPRPRPLVDAAAQGASAPVLIGTVFSSLLATGAVTAQQEQWVTITLVVLAAATTALTTIIAQIRSIRVGEQMVTPVESPRNQGGDPLVPRTSLLLEEVLAQLVLMRDQTLPGAPTGAARAAPPDPASTGPLGEDPDEHVPPPGPMRAGRHRADTVGATTWPG